MQIKTTTRYHVIPVRLATINKQQVLTRMWKKGNRSALLVGLQPVATVENSMQYPQNN